VDVPAGLVNRLGLDVPAAFVDVAPPVVARAQGRGGGGAVDVGDRHGAADQLDQFEVQRCDEQAELGVEAHRPSYCNRRGAPSASGGIRTEVEPKSGRNDFSFSADAWVRFAGGYAGW
jgi:hypothetical protein